MLSRHFYMGLPHQLNNTLEDWAHFLSLQWSLFGPLIFHHHKEMALIGAQHSFIFICPASSLLCIPYHCSLGWRQQQAPSGPCTGCRASTVLSPQSHITQNSKNTNMLQFLLLYLPVCTLHMPFYSLKSNYSGHEINSNFLQILVWNGLRLFKLL